MTKQFKFLAFAAICCAASFQISAITQKAWDTVVTDFGNNLCEHDTARAMVQAEIYMNKGMPNIREILAEYANGLEQLIRFKTALRKLQQTDKQLSKQQRTAIDSWCDHIDQALTARDYFISTARDFTEFADFEAFLRSKYCSGMQLNNSADVAEIEQFFNGFKLMAAEILNTFENTDHNK